MLIYEPARRINAREALRHPYFADLDRSMVPAYGEEFVGMPFDQMPSDLAAVFAAAAATDDPSIDQNVDVHEVSRTIL